MSGQTAWPQVQEEVAAAVRVSAGPPMRRQVPMSRDHWKTSERSAVRTYTSRRPTAVSAPAAPMSRQR
ncbi:hypothetical protein [Streptosporangium sp. KLBMP 9127]|nr:hypothetical protein [Streptosporangium sp. KLBMP 9127]